jgi:hypothetical protein
MKKILFAMLAAFAVAAPAVHAEGNYAGVALGAGSGDLTLTDDYGSIVSRNHPIPFNMYGGHAFNPNLAIEGGFTFFGEYRFSGAGAPSAVFGVLYVAAKASMKMSDQWLLTGKVGIARHGLDVETHNGSQNKFYYISTRPLFGIGTEYRFTDRVSATLELNDYGTMSNSQIHLQARALEAGFKYRF